MLASLQLKWRPDPLVPAGSYDGQTLLVTGGTSGLGLASAVHFVNLGVREIIITARSASRGQAAKQRIEEATGTTGQDRVKVMELDMNQYSSIVALVEQLKSEYSRTGGIDYALLNAGTHNASFVKSPTGWEEDIQVNALSTTLLGVLLVSWMKQFRNQRRTPAHLGFVASGGHLRMDIKDWAKYSEQEGGILSHFSQKENWLGGIPMYNVSKLMVMYGIEEIAKIAMGSDGQPEVIVNSLCPGIVGTDLSRSMTDESRAYRIVAPIFTAALAQTPDVGSRLLVDAGLTSAKEHGKFLRKWASDEEYNRRSAPNLRSPQGRKVQALAWKEIQEELVAKVPALRGLL